MSMMKLEGDYAIDKVLWAHRIASAVVALGWLAYDCFTLDGMEAYSNLLRNCRALLPIWLSDYVPVISGVFYGNCGFLNWQGFPSVIRFFGWCLLLFVPLALLLMGVPR